MLYVQINQFIPLPPKGKADIIGIETHGAGIHRPGKRGAMKAHVQKQAPLALLYNLAVDTQAGAAVRGALARCGVPVRDILPAQADCTVAALEAGGPSADGAPAAQDAPAGPALLFSSLPEATLNAALAALREAGAPVALKAVVTPTSRTWTLRALLEELSREHALMQGRSS